jgi:RNA polymerase sigma-70 factor (ECF subfamily)
LIATSPAASNVEVLWRDLHDRLVSYVSRRATSVQETEDIVQDVFLRMHLAMGASAPIDRLDAWMFRVARNAVIDQHRRRRPIGHVDDEAAPAVPERPAAEEQRNELAGCLLPFVTKLPEPYADAVRWVDVEGLTQVEAARRAGISVPGMKSRVQRGRTKLRELLDACCRFELDVRGRVVDYEAKSRCGCTPGS